jgi:hypothetical protein
MKKAVNTCGHPDRPHCGRGMCRSCYTVQWHKAHPELIRKLKYNDYRRMRKRLSKDADKLKAFKEKGRLQSAAWRENNKEKYLECARKLQNKLYHNPDGKLKRKIRGYKLKQFGMTHEDYEAMLASQNGVCATCKKPEKVRQGYGLKHLAIDHDHQTGRVRGLLCQNCNLMIGHSHDSIELLQAAIDYLKSKCHEQP